MQFDVCRNPIARARGAMPFVAVLQSDHASTGSERIIAGLVPKGSHQALQGKLAPAVTVQGKEHLLLVQSMTNLPVTELRRAVDNIATHRDAIITAIDLLFLGF